MVDKQKQVAPVYLLSVGAFGQSVGRYLKELRADVVETLLTSNTLPSLETWPEARVHVLVSWRPVPRLCELLDETSYESGRTYFPVVLDSSVLRLGPIVVPGKGGCWRCWVRRSAQHAEWSKERSALLEFYSSNTTVGPRGFLEPFAMIAASQIALAVNALDLSTEIAGHIWEMDLLRRQITTSTLIGIHDCPRCGLNRPTPTRSVAEIRNQLAYLWKGTPGE